MLGGRGGEEGADTVGRAVGEGALGCIRGGDDGAVFGSDKEAIGSTELIFLIAGFSSGVITEGRAVAGGGSAGAVGGVSGRGAATGAEANLKVSGKSGIVITPGSDW